MAGPRIDYIELPSVTAHELTRAFYSRAFGWTFSDYGPDYSATTTGDVDVGLNGQSDEALAAPLPVVRVDDVDAAFASVTKAGGVIAKPIFDFPGGRRFH
nr:VOC family protein [Sphingomonas sp.]